jgi:hypothetical protein
MEKTLKILLKEERRKVIAEVESFCPLADMHELTPKCQCPYHHLSEYLSSKV